MAGVDAESYSELEVDASDEEDESGEPLSIVDELGRHICEGGSSSIGFGRSEVEDSAMQAG